MAMTSTPRGALGSLSPRSAPSGQAGFSLIEGLISAVIVLMITLGLIPLIASSMNNTAAGRDYSTASQFGRSRVDEVYQMPSQTDALVVPDTEEEQSTVEFWDAESHGWTGISPSGTAPWERGTTVRQYNVGELRGNRLTRPLVGAARAPQVHLREIIVEVENTREAGAIGGGREVAMTTLKGF